MVKINIHRNWSYHVCCMVVSAIVLFKWGFWHAAFLVGATVFIITVHELSHAAAARIVGMKVQRVRVYPGYGYTQLATTEDDWKKPRWLAIVVAGPVSGWFTTYAVYAATLHLGLPVGLTGVLHLLFLAVSADTLVNLLPIGNLDGGHLAETLKVLFWGERQYRITDDTNSNIQPQHVSDLPAAGACCSHKSFRGEYHEPFHQDNNSRRTYGWHCSCCRPAKRKAA